MLKNALTIVASRLGFVVKRRREGILRADQTLF